MKTHHFFGILLTGAVIMLGCEKEWQNDFVTVIGTGDIVTKNLELNPFTELTLAGVANLYISLGEKQSVSISAQQNIIDITNWEVTAGGLIISIDENVRLENHKEIRFDIVVTNLSAIQHSGIGDIILEGPARSFFEIDYRGIGHVLAYGLPVDNCTVYSNGPGDCKVMVNDNLEVDISGIGNIYYRGIPEITVTDTGLGELVNDN